MQILLQYSAGSNGLASALLARQKQPSSLFLFQPEPIKFAEALRKLKI